MSFDELNGWVSILIGIITLLGFVVSTVSWKWRQALKTHDFRGETNHDIKKLIQDLASLCNRIMDLEKKVEKEVIATKEDHLLMEARATKTYQELADKIDSLTKSLYLTMGKLEALEKKL